MSRQRQIDNWNAATEETRANPEQRRQLLDSVQSSLAIEGMEIDRERLEAIYDRVLDGPPLVFEGLEWG